MTVVISTQTETMLREQAGRLGQDADALADAMLQHALQEAARDHEESCAAIAEALAGDPAEDLTLEQYRAQFEVERETRRQREAA